MVKILNGNDEIVRFEQGKQFEILEVWNGDVFFGYNLMLEDELIDTYDEEEFAIAVMNELCRLIDDIDPDFIDIEEINKMLEIL